MPSTGQAILSPKGLRWLSTGHPWVYKSDIVSVAAERAGMVDVVSLKKQFLAKALYSPASQIALRILSYENEEVDAAWWRRILVKAIDLRKRMALGSNAVRFVNSEGDGIPSLIVDSYDGYLALQFLSAGIEEFKGLIIGLLKDILSPKGILVKNDVSVRAIEGLPQEDEVALGLMPEHVVIEEGPCRFLIRLAAGQKTGAFLDQRASRLRVGTVAYGTAADVFSYEGWFACHMARRAERVTCVESSEAAASHIQENAKLNGVEGKMEVITANAFDWLADQAKGGKIFDFINLDPPPFVRSRKHLEAAYRGYKEIHVRALQLLKENKGWLATASCSYGMSWQDFEAMLGDAGHDVGIWLQILGSYGPDADHPYLLSHPEGDYLKCYFARVY